MAIFKKIAFWVIWIVGILIKLPIAIVSALIQLIEMKYAELQMLLARWYGEEWAVSACNEGIRNIVDSYEYISCLYRDMEIEL